MEHSIVSEHPSMMADDFCDYRVICSCGAVIEAPRGSYPTVGAARNLAYFEWSIHKHEAEGP